MRSVGSDICRSCCFPNAHRPLILQNPSWLQALQLASVLPYHISLSLHRATSLAESGVASCSLLSPSLQGRCKFTSWDLSFHENQYRTLLYSIKVSRHFFCQSIIAPNFFHAKDNDSFSCAQTRVTAMGNPDLSSPTKSIHGKGQRS